MFLIFFLTDLYFFPDTNIITGIDESQGPYTSGEEIFGEELTPSTDAALANQFGNRNNPVQQMPRLAAKGGIISLVS